MSNPTRTHLARDPDYLCPGCRRPTSYTVECTSTKRTYLRYCSAHEHICGWPGHRRVEIPCPDCLGDGYFEYHDPSKNEVFKEQCELCLGEGWITEEED